MNDFGKLDLIKMALFQIHKSRVMMPHIWLRVLLEHVKVYEMQYLP